MLKYKSRTAALVLIYIICLAVCRFFIGAWVQDDSFISFRYAENFMKGEGLVYNPGEYVQGYTNFLWIIILGGISYSGVSFVYAALVLNVIITLITGIGTAILISGGKNNEFRPIFAGMFFLSAPNVLCWTVGGGLEGLFFTIVIFFGCSALLSGRAKGNKKFIPAGILFALATFIRPEGVIIFAASMITYAVLYRQYYIPVCLWKGIYTYLGFIIPYILWCYFYYGSLLPNTFYAKALPNFSMILPGLHYAYRFYMSIPILTALFILSLVSFRVLPVMYKFINVMILVITTYVIIIGGDFMAAGRFFLPAMPFLAISGSDSFLNVLMGRKTGRRDKKDVIYAAGVLIVIYQVLSISYSQDYKTSILSTANEKVGTLTGDYLGHTYPGCTVAAGGIGMLGFFSKLKTIDITGLIDKTIANSSSTLVSSMPQHSRSNAGYVMRRKPDLIFFGLPPGRSNPGILAELEIFKHPDFLNYEFRQDITLRGDTINYYLRKGYLMK